MAGITDLPFRVMNRSFGCAFAFTEMISANSVVHGSKHTLRMLSTAAEDRPLGIQILGADAEIIRRALDMIAPFRFDLVDLNAACPVSKVVSRGEGSALLKSTPELQKILEVMVQCTTSPVTVKIRSGWDDASINAVEAAQRAEDAGARGIFLHGRTKKQGYAGTVDYGVIRAVKQSVQVPVIASGDALSPALIKRMLNETGCDGVAVARGALGNPWIFRNTEAFLREGNELPDPDRSELIRIMLGHLDSNISFYGEKTGVMLFRKFFIWYARGLAVKDLKFRAFRAATRAEMSRLIRELEGYGRAVPGAA
jgi:tRNA-dihydrouridine synthase B